MNDVKRIIITGGGTGGHVYPGIAIANELKKLDPGIEITFVGVKNRIESKIVPREGYPLKTIHVEYLSRKLSIKTVTFFFSLITGIVQSLSFLKNYRPNAVVGTGGYVSGPVVYAANLLKIPMLIQEQNSYPGITTRLLAPKVTEIHLAFEEAARYLDKVKDKSKFKFTGNPVRLSDQKDDRETALAKFKLNPKRKTLFLFGGSQGASALNVALLETLPNLSENIQIIWQTGEPDYQMIKDKTASLPHQKYIRPFIYNMAEAYSAADLAFCRAGAITIAELVQMGIPSILVPLPHAAEAHQKKNASVLAKAGAAEMILQQNLTAELLKNRIENLIFDDGELTRMKKNTQQFYHENAAEKIAKCVLEIME